MRPNNVRRRRNSNCNDNNTSEEVSNPLCSGDQNEHSYENITSYRQSTPRAIESTDVTKKVESRGPNRLSASDVVDEDVSTVQKEFHIGVGNHNKSPLVENCVYSDDVRPMEPGEPPVNQPDNSNMPEESYDLSCLVQQNMSDSDSCSSPSTDSDDNEKESALVQERKRPYFKTWTPQNLGTLLFLMGAKRLSDDQYRDVIRKLNSFFPRTNVVEKSQKSNGTFPSLSTYRRVLKPLAEETLFASSTKETFSQDGQKAGSQSTAYQKKGTSDTDVLVVLPSEWARMDFKTSYMKELLWGSQSRNRSESEMFEYIESCPIAQHRSSLLTQFRLQTKEGREISIRKGTEIELHIPQSAKLENTIKIFELKGCISPVHDRSQDTCLKLPVHNISLQQKEAVKNYSEDNCANSRNGDIEILFETLVGKVYAILRGITLPGAQEFRQRIFFQHPDESLSFHLNITSIFTSGNELERYRPVQSCGKLKDGTRYYVYRFILYNDGFSPLTKPSSLDGCYILLAGVPPSQRTPASCIRRLWLAPPGVSSRKVINLVVDDVLQASTHGIKVQDGDETATIFLDVMSYIGDYPAVTEMLDVIGHTGLVPCHLCLFHRGDASTTDTRYGYDTTINSGNICFRRGCERVMSMRRSAIKSDQLKYIGVRKVSGNESFESPFHRLSVKLLMNYEKIPRTHEGLPVISPFFDPYRSCLIAADHMFHGLCVNVMNATLCAMTPCERRDAESLLCSYISRFKMGNISGILNSDSKSLRTMTMSETNIVLLLFPECVLASMSRCRLSVREQKRQYRQEIVIILFQFSSLYHSTLFRPRSSHNERDTVSFYTKRNGEERLQELRINGRQYVSHVNVFCKKFPMFKEFLDKPNLHRLVEFYQHTLPLYGNTSFILELILERAHQDLKYFVKRSNQKMSHIQAMENVLATDWFSRMESELRRLGETKESMKGLLYLLGKDGLSRDVSDGEYRYVKDTFTSELQEHFISKSQLFDRPRTDLWVPGKPINLEEHGDQYSSILQQAMKDVREHITNKYSQVYSDLTDTSISVLGYEEISCKKRTDRKSSKKYVACKESILESLVEFVPSYCKNRIQFMQYSRQGKRTFFYCQQYFYVGVKTDEGTKHHLFSLALPLKKVQESITQEICVSSYCTTYHFPRGGSSVLVEIDDHFRLCISAHACWMSACSEKSKICPLLKEHAKYVIKGSHEGYPPREG